MSWPGTSYGHIAYRQRRKEGRKEGALNLGLALTFLGSLPLHTRIYLLSGIMLVFVLSGTPLPRSVFSVLLPTYSFLLCDALQKLEPDQMCENDTRYYYNKSYRTRYHNNTQSNQETTTTPPVFWYKLLLYINI